MNNLRNRVQLIGNLGADTETKITANGKKLVKMSLATKDVYRDQQGEKQTDTQWHNLVAFGKNAETLSTYGKKGNQLAVSGKLTHRSYEDDKGNKRTYTEIVVQEFVFLRSANAQSAGRPAATMTA